MKSWRGPHARGFSLIELMVTVAIVAILMVLAAPSVGTSVVNARDRTVVQKLIQDFTWARGAAGATNASALMSGQTGLPTVTLQINSDCSWATKITTTSGGTVQDTTHSMATTATPATTAAGELSLSSMGVNNLSCVGGQGITLPQTFSFNSQGTIGTSGTVTVTDSVTNQTFTLNFVYSGSVFRSFSSST